MDSIEATNDSVVTTSRYSVNTFGAQIEWRPFDLHPEYPPEGIPRAELERRYGAGLADRRREMFEQAGLPHAEPLEKVSNSRGALMLAELARDRGKFDELHPRLFDAYWARGLDIGDEQVNGLIDRYCPLHRFRPIGRKKDSVPGFLEKFAS